MSNNQECTDDDWLGVKDEPSDNSTSRTMDQRSVEQQPEQQHVTLPVTPRSRADEAIAEDLSNDHTERGAPENDTDQQEPPETPMETSLTDAEPSIAEATGIKSTRAVSDDSSQQSANAPAAKQQDLTIAVENPREEPPTPGPKSGFSWSSNESEQDTVADVGNTNEPEQVSGILEDSTDSYTRYAYDPYAEPAGEGEITASTPEALLAPEPVQDDEDSRGRQQHQSSLTRIQSSSSRSASPGSYVRYPADAIIVVPDDARPVQRPMQEPKYTGHVVPAITGYSTTDNDNVLQRPRAYMSDEGLLEYAWESTERPLQRVLSDEPVYNQTNERGYNVRKAIYRAAAGKPIYRSWATSVQNASSPPNSPPKETSTGQFLRDKISEARDTDQSLYTGYRSNHASRNTSMAGNDAASDAGSPTLQVHEGNMEDSDSASNDRNEAPEPTPPANGGEASDDGFEEDEWNNSSSGSNDSNDFQDGSSGATDAAKPSEGPSDSADASEYVLEDDEDDVQTEGSEGRLFAPLSSGTTLERPTTSHGPAEDESEDNAPSTPPVDEEGERPTPEQPGTLVEQQISPTSPDRWGREPHTGMTPEQGYDAWKQYRMGIKDGSRSRDNRSFLQGQRMVLKEKTGARQSHVGSIQNYTYVKDKHADPEAAIHELADWGDYWRMRMLKYRYERNEELARVGRRDQMIESLHDQIREINQEWGNAVGTERQNREAAEQNLERVRSERNDFAMEVARGQTQLNESDEKYERLKGKCQKLADKVKDRMTEVAQWKTFAESNEASARLWREHQDAEIEAAKTRELDLAIETPLPTTPQAMAETPALRTRPASIAATRVNDTDEEVSRDESSPNTSLREWARVHMGLDLLELSESPASGDAVWSSEEQDLVTTHLRDWINEHRHHGSSEAELTSEDVSDLLGDGHQPFEHFVAALAERAYLVDPEEMKQALVDRLDAAGFIPKHEDSLAEGERADKSNKSTGRSQPTHQTGRDHQAQIDRLTVDRDGQARGKADAQAQLQKCKQHGQELQKTIEGLKTKLHDKKNLEADLEECRRHGQQLKAKIAELKAELEKRKNLEADLEECREHGRQLRASLEGSERDNQEMRDIAEQIVNDTDEQVERLEAEVGRVRQDNDLLSQRAELADAGVYDAPLTGGLRERYEYMDREYTLLVRDINTLDKANADLEAELEYCRTHCYQQIAETRERQVSPPLSSTKVVFSPTSLLNRNGTAYNDNNGYPSAMPTSDVTRTPHIAPPPRSPFEMEPKRWQERMKVLRQTPEYIADERRRRKHREAKQAYEKSRLGAIERAIAKQLGKDELEYVPKEKRWAHLKL